jgi:hypothetical protein
MMKFSSSFLLFLIFLQSFNLPSLPSSFSDLSPSFLFFRFFRTIAIAGDAQLGHSFLDRIGAVPNVKAKEARRRSKKKQEEATCHIMVETQAIFKTQGEKKNERRGEMSRIEVLANRFRIT